MATKTIEVVYRAPFSGMDVRHNPEAAMGVESQTGVRRDFGDVRGLEPPLTTVMPTSPIRAEYYHRSTQTHYVVAGTTIYKKTGTEAFQRVMNPDGTSIAVVPGSGIVRIVPFDNAIVIQAD